MTLLRLYISESLRTFSFWLHDTKSSVLGRVWGFLGLFIYFNNSIYLFLSHIFKLFKFSFLALQPKATQTLYQALHCPPFAFFFFFSCLLWQHLHKHRICRSIKKFKLEGPWTRPERICHQAGKMWAAHWDSHVFVTVEHSHFSDTTGNKTCIFGFFCVSNCLIFY